MNDWKEMKSVPKKADSLILFGELLTYCCNQSDRGEPMGKAVVFANRRQERWWANLYEVIPTHWMPVPEPPEK